MMSKKPFRPSLPTIPSSYYGNATTYPHDGSIRERIGDLLGKESTTTLPMYKDKPKAYPPTTRRSGTGNKIGAALIFVVGILWLAGLIPGFPTDVEREGASSFFRVKQSAAVWRERQEAVKDAFVLSWDYYAEHAWGMDEFHPISQTSKNIGCSKDSHATEKCPPIGWIIVDALDTAMMMNLTSRVAQAREWIATSLDFSKVDNEVSTFETTIRVVGGLLSAHYLSTQFPDLAPLSDDDVGAKGEDLYIEKAVDLADRLLGAFDTPTGIPLSACILNSSVGVGSRGDMGAASTAEATTLQLELKYVAKLVGEPLYWTKAEQVMKAVDAPRHEGGLLPIFIDPITGDFRGQTIRLGSRGDSYYEYLIKQYLQTGSRESIYLDMWNESLQGLKDHLLTWGRDSNFTILGERQSGLGEPMTGKMDHLVCFLPGTIALAVTGGATVAQAKAKMGTAWGRQQEEDLRLAEELAKTCYGMYYVTPTGLAPEITYFELDNPARMWNATNTTNLAELPKSAEFNSNLDSAWRKDYDIHRNDVHNLQRPETIESLFYLWRITGDVKYREWGWQIFQSFLRHTAVRDPSGKILTYTSIESVMNPDMRITIQPASDNAGKKVTGGRDNMEGFWLAETLKYLYLLFEDNVSEWNDLENIVINTEAHFFPRFDIGEEGKVWKTGWKRKQKGEWEQEKKDKKDKSP